MRTQAIRSRENPNLELIAFHGHFATRHSHNSHYLDITRLKHEYSLAHDTALALANHYIYEKSIDTIICMDGSEVIGAFLARQLTQKILFSVNNNKSICVVTPEYDSNGQLLFRKNLVSMIHGRNMLLLISTVNSGKTARRALDCIQYYGGTHTLFSRNWKSRNAHSHGRTSSLSSGDTFPGPYPRPEGPAVS